MFIVNFVNDKKDEAEMARSFKALDLNKDGVISLEELQKGLARYLGVDEARALGLARQIFKKVDLNNSGSIDFSGTSSSPRVPHLRQQHRDHGRRGQSRRGLRLHRQGTCPAMQDKSGKLSVTEIRDKLGSNISEDVYNNLLKDFDVNNDG